MHVVKSFDAEKFTVKIKSLFSSQIQSAMYSGLLVNLITPEKLASRDPYHANRPNGFIKQIPSLTVIIAMAHNVHARMTYFHGPYV